MYEPKIKSYYESKTQKGFADSSEDAALRHHYYIEELPSWNVLPESRAASN